MPAGRAKEDFLRSVADFIDAHNLLAPAERVLVAVSGGSDSVALALALRDLAAEPHRRYRLHLAHLDHGLRGEESAEDARFVANLRAAPRRIRETLFRSGRPRTDRTRPAAAPASPRRGLLRASQLLRFLPILPEHNRLCRW